MKYTILQLDIDNPFVIRDHKLFESWGMLNNSSGFDICDYKKVYEGEVEEQSDLLHTLDYLFEKFNLNHPKDFRGHSLSVSDVITIDDINYYCDNYGWVNTSTGKVI